MPRPPTVGARKIGVGAERKAKLTLHTNGQAGHACRRIDGRARPVHAVRQQLGGILLSRHTPGQQTCAHLCVLAPTTAAAERGWGGGGQRAHVGGGLTLKLACCQYGDGLLFEAASSCASTRSTGSVTAGLSSRLKRAVGATAPLISSVFTRIKEGGGGVSIGGSRARAQ
jgi:hypothetical protein